MVSVIGIPLDENSSFLKSTALASDKIREAFHSLSANYFSESGVCPLMKVLTINPALHISRQAKSILCISMLLKDNSGLIGRVRMQTGLTGMNLIMPMLQLGQLAWVEFNLTPFILWAEPIMLIG